MAKVYSYIRFSTPEQAKGDSYRRQVERIKKYCRENNHIFDNHLTIADLGKSGYSKANLESGRLGLFLDAVADGHVEPGSILFVESFDRISRADLFTAMGVLGKLLEAGITVVAGDREYTHAIFRASGLSLLGVSNSHVETDRRKIVRGEQQSPILLVRDKARGRVIIADGYHRLCAVYTFDEDALIPCRIV